MRERLLYLFLLLVLGLVACGEDKEEGTTGGSGGGTRAAGLEPAPTQDVGADAAALVPADAQAVVCIRSLDRVAAMLKSFAEAVGERVPTDPKMELAQMTGVDPALVDGSRRILAAASMTREAPLPFTTFVLPVTDMEKAAAGAALPFQVQRAGYLGMSTIQGYAAGEGSKLLEGLPDGDLVLRIDLAAITKLYDDEIQGALMMGQGFLGTAIGSQMPGVDAAGMVGKIFGFARDVISSAELLDIVGSAKGGVVDVDLAYTAKESSPLAKPGEGSALDSLAKYVPSDFPFASLFAFDRDTLLEWTRASAEMAKQNMPPEEAEAYVTFMKTSEELFEYVSGDWLMAGKVGKGGISLVMAAGSKDPGAYIAKYLELTKDPSVAKMGLTAEVEAEREVAGVKVQRVRLTIDSEKFGAAMGFAPGEIDMFVALVFGTGGINLDLAAAGDHLVMVIGGTDSLAAAVLGASEPTPAMRAARAEARGDLGFLVHVEVRSLMQGIAALATKAGEKAPTIPDGPPAPLTLYGSREKRVYRFGIHVDAEQMKSVVQAMD